MFFFYGWGTKAKPLDLYVNGTCGICNNLSRLRVIVQYDYFSLFFIPIIKWNKRYYLECSYCGNVLPIDKQTYLDIKNGVYPQQTPQQATEDPFGGEFENKIEGATENTTTNESVEEKTEAPSASEQTETTEATTTEQSETNTEKE